MVNHELGELMNRALMKIMSKRQPGPFRGFATRDCLKEVFLGVCHIVLPV